MREQPLSEIARLPPHLRRIYGQNNAPEHKTQYDNGQVPTASMPFVHVALIREMLEEAHQVQRNDHAGTGLTMPQQDTTYLDWWMHGLPIVGDIPQSGLWPGNLLLLR